MSSPYIQLFKRTLSYQLWPEPLHRIKLQDAQQAEISRVLAGIESLKGFDPNRLRVGVDVQVSDKDRATVTFWPEVADTMVGMLRLENVEECVRVILDEGIPGDFIECGIWRGGVCMLMRALLLEAKVTDRVVYVADSFRGLPPPDAAKYPLDEGDVHYTASQLAVSRGEVEERFRRLGLLDDQVRFIEGWFCETLPKAPIERLALLRLDGDMYGSTMDILNNLYDKLSPGGFCIVDDYSLPACRQAITDFRRDRRIEDTIVEIDWTGVYWRKSR
jgi:O-methyltransferase